MENLKLIFATLDKMLFKVFPIFPISKNAQPSQDSITCELNPGNFPQVESKYQSLQFRA